MNNAYIVALSLSALGFVILAAASVYAYIAARKHFEAANRMIEARTRVNDAAADLMKLLREDEIIERQPADPEGRAEAEWAAQPQPTRRDVLPLVVEDLHARVAKGTAEYGEPLRTFNGRDALRDAYEEALDLALYLRQEMEERETALAGALPPDSYPDFPSGDPLAVTAVGENGFEASITLPPSAADALSKGEPVTAARVPPGTYLSLAELFEAAKAEGGATITIIRRDQPQGPGA